MVGRSLAGRHKTIGWLSALLLGGLALPSPAHSQYVDFRLFGGPAVTSMNGSYVESATETWGFTGGATAYWHLNRRWALEGSFAWIQKGGWTLVSPAVEGAWDYRFSYIEFPLLVNFLFPFSGDRWVFGIFGGAAPSIGMGCDVKPNDETSFKDTCSTDTAGGELEKFDLVAMLGVKLEKVFSGGSGYGFYAKFNQGTQNVLSGAAEEGLSARNFGLDVTLRLFIPLGGPTPGGSR